MQGASKAHANIGVRTLTGMTIIAATFIAGGVQRAWADPPAPIVYAKALAEQNAPISFDQFQGRSAPANSAPIDLRPGAVKTSFGPALPPVSRFEQPRALTSAPMAWAEPYAGPPYQVEGKWYVPTYEPNYDEVGIASWYGPTFHGKDAASGEQFDENAMTAAHPTLPIPSLVRVTNLENGKSVIVRLNDRGPFVDDRIIDLSTKAGQALDMHAKGTAKVRVQYVGPAPAAPNSLPVQSSQIQATPVPVSPVQAAVPAVQPVIATQPASEPPPSFVTQPLSPVVPVQLSRAPQIQNQRGYFLQAGSFADLGNAHAFRDKLQDVGPVSMTAVQINGTEFYRVMVGPWTSRVEAERAQGRLIEGGTKAIVIARLD